MIEGETFGGDSELESVAASALDALCAVTGASAATLFLAREGDGLTPIATRGGPRAPQEPDPPRGGRELRVELALAEETVGVAVLRPDRPGPLDAEARSRLDQVAAGATASLARARALREALRLTTINRAVLDAVRDGIVLVDCDGGLILCNQRAEELARTMTGKAMAEVVHQADALAGHTTDPEAFLAATRRLEANREEPGADEFQLRDSGRRFARYAEPVRMPGGRLIGQLLVVREVTRERDVEHRKDELIATIAHELRSPVAIISGFIELLASSGRADGGDQPELDILLAEARRLQALIDDLLDLERLERGAIRVRTDPFDLTEVLAAQVRLHRGPATRHTLELDAPEQPVYAFGERDRIVQVVSNLLSNAIKYSPDGGVVRVEARPTGRLVTVTISDPGLGIPEDQQPRIFERFFRAGEERRQASIPGTGLGLALSRQIVLAHGGTLDFSSRPGDGSRFWFTLPVAPNVAARPEDEPRGLSAASPRR